MNESGQVYADLAEFIPEADRKRLEEAERREQQRLREVLTDEAAARLERKIAEAEDKAFIHGS